MLLVIDVGNTNTTLGVYRDEDLQAEWRLTTNPAGTVDEYGVQTRSLFQLAGMDFHDIEAIVVASVVPPLNNTIKGMAEVYLQRTPLFIDHTTDTGLKIIYEPASDVGVDRIVDAVAAVSRHGKPCIVVDFGTATTFNAVNYKGEYIGGLIAPGLKISAEALISRTSKLPRVEIKRPAKVIGSSTVEAMQSGLYFGYASLVDGVLRRMIAEMGETPCIVATGGLASVIADGSELIEKVDDTLTLEGLRLIYQRSR
jgi:type III pantothenate kinase